MARGSDKVARRPGRLDSGAPFVPTGGTLLGVPPLGKDPATQEVRPEGRICISAGRYLFVDPKWGPTSFDFSIWRDARGGLPEYEVIIE